VSGTAARARRIAALALCGLAPAACSTPPHKDAPAMPEPADPATDVAFVAQLRRAVNRAIDPATIEAQLGKRALIKTATGYPLAGLRRVSIEADPEHPQETLALDRARVVIYWERPGAGPDPHIVGIQVHDDGAASVFFGIVLPP